VGVIGRVIIKMNIKEISCDDLGWINVVQDRVQWE
jgi:hypothetical protein